MKKLIIALAVAVCSTVSFTYAQDDKKMDPKMSHKKEASIHCYAMKDSHMSECWGKTGKPMTNDATLKNGTKVSTTGEVTMMNGEKEMLKNGQCILANSGRITNLDKAHPKHKMMDKKM